MLGTARTNGLSLFLIVASGVDPPLAARIALAPVIDTGRVLIRLVKDLLPDRVCYFPTFFWLRCEAKIASITAILNRSGVQDAKPVELWCISS